MIEGEISIQGTKFFFGIVVGIGLPSLSKREIVEKKIVEVWNLSWNNHYFVTDVKPTTYW